MLQINSNTPVVILELAIGIFAMAAAISGIFFLVSRGKVFLRNSQEQYVELYELEGQIMSLDGEKISGSEAKAYAFQLYGSMGILFVTKGCETGFYDLDFVNDSASEHFVPNDAEFVCHVIRQDGVDVGVSFTQVGLAEVPFTTMPTVAEIARLDREVLALQQELHIELMRLSEAEYDLLNVTKIQSDYSHLADDVQNKAEVDGNIESLEESVRKKMRISGELNESTMQEKLESVSREIEATKRKISRLQADLQADGIPLPQ